MQDCVFCKIVKGEIPCHKVYEDEDFLGFLDINPKVEGHSLLIPKRHYRWVYDVPDFGRYWETVKKLALAAKKVLKAEFITFLTHGLEVPHAHIHIMPRKKGEYEFVPSVKSFSKEELEKIAEKIFQEVK